MQQTDRKIKVVETDREIAMDFPIFSQVVLEIRAFAFADALTVAALAVLEGIFSVDNSLVLAILVRTLPKKQQKKALTYGIVGAFAFRFLALVFAAHLMRFVVFKRKIGMSTGCCSNSSVRKSRLRTSYHSTMFPRKLFPISKKKAILKSAVTRNSIRRLRLASNQTGTFQYSKETRAVVSPWLDRI
jgi:RNase P protein component